MCWETFSGLVLANINAAICIKQSELMTYLDGFFDLHRLTNGLLEVNCRFVWYSTINKYNRSHRGSSVYLICGLRGC